ncbi:Ribosomal protein S25 [Spironucleus salmonicida]|uniref:40S ribosomal protein S25 n=1 Tax=Spironucleus salmonicida TaxID=348837 RepID=V6LB03_9EUKA|nr:Ribosomal protein S25 [Spironucleus salmonicida]|eukprot:EST41597.1 Ribosomal protein S25 [Spironucleus salmonicida]
MSQNKKQWTKSNKKDKIYQDTVFADQAALEAALVIISSMKIVTLTSVCDRCKIGASLARKAIQHLVEKNTIQLAYTHSSLKFWVNPQKVAAKQ